MRNIVRERATPERTIQISRPTKRPQTSASEEESPAENGRARASATETQPDLPKQHRLQRALENSEQEGTKRKYGEDYINTTTTEAPTAGENEQPGEARHT